MTDAAQQQSADQNSVIGIRINSVNSLTGKELKVAINQVLE